MDTQIQMDSETQDPATSGNSTTNTNNNNTNAMQVSSSESPGPQIILRDPTTRPAYKLSVKLIDTYKYINKVYYEAKARRLREQKDSARGGVHNDGYDDQNYDYILVGDEIFNDRYILKHRMGRVSQSHFLSNCTSTNRSLNLTRVPSDKWSAPMINRINTKSQSRSSNRENPSCSRPRPR